MYPVDRALPFYTSLLMLAVMRYYPMDSKHYNEKKFLWILYIWTAFWAGNILSIYLAFFTNLFTGHFDDFIEELAYCIGHTSAMCCCLFFAQNHKEWSNFFESIARYEKFGKPPKYDQVIEHAAKCSRLYVAFSVVGLGVFFAFPLLDEENCDKKFKGHKLCGMLNPTWWPSSWLELNLVSKRLLLVYQILSDCTLSQFSLVSLLIYEAGELIGAKIDHMSTLFDEICSIQDQEEQFQKCIYWIKYHQDTIRLCIKLNHVSRRSVGHITLTVATILACLLCQYMKEATPKTGVYIVVYLITVSIICHAGQRVEDEMLNIGDLIYSKDWFQCGQKTRRLIPLIILRSQRRFGIDALPIGKTNYMLFFKILKTAYSYFTLFNKKT